MRIGKFGIQSVTPARLPQYGRFPELRVEMAGDDEQQIRQAIEVVDGVRIDLILASQRNDAPLRAAANGARDVAYRRDGCAAGQNEFTQWLKSIVETIQNRLKLSDVALFDDVSPRHAQLAP